MGKLSRAKAEGTDIFSIAFEINNSVTRKMLEDCASQKSMFFNASNPQQLIRAFKDIAGQIEVAEGVRITR